eukprot:3896260-Pyramimonas_sp.AAC.1
MLKDWGYDSTSVCADPEEGKVWVGSEIALHVTIDGGTLKVEHGPGWEDWLTGADFPQFPEMVQNLREKLQRIPAKGIGKNGPKGKGGKGQESH